MCATFVVRYRVDFVDDYGADAAEVLARFAGGEQDVKRLGRGNEDMRRATQHLRAIFGESIAGADAGADFGAQIAAGEG